MNELLRELIEIMRFTERVSAKIHGMIYEHDIYKVVREEFGESRYYTGSILLLTDDGSKLRIAESSLTSRKRREAEKIAGLRLKECEIDLNRSSIYSQVVREGKTVVANVDDTIAELFPRPMAHLISKVLRYQDKKSIVTPLSLGGRIVGALAMTCPELVEEFIPSIRNLAEHISNALELANERAERERKVKEALKRWENVLSSIIDQSPFPTCIMGANGTSIWKNAACRRAFGIDWSEQLAGKCTMFLDPVVKKQGLIGEITKVFAEGKTVTFTLNFDLSEVDRLNVSPGTHRIFPVTIFPVKDENGKVINAVVQHEDITERKKIEEEREKVRAELIQSAKMATVGTQASGIAHEFNNLVQVMRGHIEFAQKTKKQKDIKQALNIFLDTSDRAEKIIRNLLNFSRQELSEKELCDITEVVESILSLIESQLKRCNIRIIRQYKNTPMVEVNKPEMQQVFLDMVVNARDAMLPKGGKLKVSVKRAKKNVEISFSDTGIGIEKENLNRLFEPFYTTKGSLEGSTISGTGLGLYVSYGIIRRHKGSIEVRSRVGRGSTFTVRLPLGEVKLGERGVK